MVGAADDVGTADEVGAAEEAGGSVVGSARDVDGSGSTLDIVVLVPYYN